MTATACTIRSTSRTSSRRPFSWRHSHPSCFAPPASTPRGRSSGWPTSGRSASTCGRGSARPRPRRGGRTHGSWPVSRSRCAPTTRSTLRAHGPTRCSGTRSTRRTISGSSSTATPPTSATCSPPGTRLRSPKGSAASATRASPTCRCASCRWAGTVPRASSHASVSCASWRRSAPSSERAVTDASPGPLAGIRILEVGHILAGPFAGMLLADLGADVIKIEPIDGDLSRQVGSDYVGEHNVYFASLNRNKRSVHIDLTTEEGRAELGALAERADALLVNLRPSTIRKLGLDYASLRRFNPKIVCVALTGYGLEGPAAEWPAFDYVIQAGVGVAGLTGEPDGPPTLPGYSAVDNSSAIVAALALVAKVHEGEGGQVDVSPFDVLLSQLNYKAAAYLNGGDIPGRQSLSAHNFYVPAQLFETA